MSQINFRIDENSKDFIEYMCGIEGKSIAAISKEIFMESLNKKMMPYLAELYRVGKISIRKISDMTGMHFIDVMDEIPKFIDDIECDPEILDYSEKVGEKILPLLKAAAEKGISFKGKISEK